MIHLLLLKSESSKVFTKERSCPSHLCCSFCSGRFGTWCGRCCSERLRNSAGCQVVEIHGAGEPFLMLSFAVVFASMFTIFLGEIWIWEISNVIVNQRSSCSGQVCFQNNVFSIYRIRYPPMITLSTNYSMLKNLSNIDLSSVTPQVGLSMPTQLRSGD